MMDRVAFAPSRTIEDDRLIPPRGPIPGYPGTTLFYDPHSHSIVLHRPIVLILGYKFKVTSPKHRRPDRHNLSLTNPQQYFFDCAIVRYRHLSTSIAYFS
jgi:hypothetical protein